jgi:hypothetical protein
VLDEGRDPTTTVNVKWAIGVTHGLVLIDAASCDCPEEAARNEAVNPPVAGLGEPVSEIKTAGALEVGVDHFVPTQLESRSTTVSPIETTTVRPESWRVNTKVWVPMVVGGEGIDVPTVLVGTVTAVVGTDCGGPVAGVDVGVERPCPGWDGAVVVREPAAPARPSEPVELPTDDPEQVGEHALPRWSRESDVRPGSSLAEEAPEG